MELGGRHSSFNPGTHTVEAQKQGRPSQGPSFVRPGDSAPSLYESRCHTLPIECCLHVSCHLAYVCIGEHPASHWTTVALTGTYSASRWGQFLSQGSSCLTQEGQSRCPCPAVYTRTCLALYWGRRDQSLSQHQPCSYLVYSTLTVREDPACHCPAGIWDRIFGWGCRAAEYYCEAASATCSHLHQPHSMRACWSHLSLSLSQLPSPLLLPFLPSHPIP